jgi:hypothetical protein
MSFCLHRKYEKDNKQKDIERWTEKNSMKVQYTYSQQYTNWRNRQNFVLQMQEEHVVIWKHALI